MTRLVDLDDLAGLERAWAELARVHMVRAIDPELRANILRHVAPDVAEPVLRDLDRLHPEIVLQIHFTTIVPNRPTIGAKRRESSTS